MQLGESDVLHLSGIQHFAFCRRQWALIHVEQLWIDNLHTVEGEIFHNRAHDTSLRELRGNLLTLRGLSIFSRSLGIVGKCDVVEFRQSCEGIALYGEKGRWIPIPVEYKKGKPKEHQADELQLCAQAMCLEEMLCCHIEQGYLFYGEPKRRSNIIFTSELRAQVSEMLVEMHEYLKKGYTPKVRPGKQCRACSLSDICIPKLKKTQTVQDYCRIYMEDREE